jgi:protein involved in polysaccharide export with SLBB domain
VRSDSGTLRSLGALATLVAALGAAGCVGPSATRYQGHAPPGYGTAAPVTSVPPATAIPAPPPHEPPPPAAVVASRPAGTVPGMTFRFQVGDEVSTTVWKEPDLATQQRVLSDGTISPPLLRVTPVVGLTVDELQGRLEHAYKEYLVDPKVSVKVVAIHSDRAFVLGEVRMPQAVPLVGPTSLVQGVALAGGFAEEFADKRHVHLIRRLPDGSPSVERIDTRAILEGRAADVPLRRGDVVFVPARGVTEWARTVGQALSPLGTAVGTAGAITTIQQAR